MQPTPQTLAEHAAFVRSLARALVADPHGADDVVQETWLAALERPPRHGSNPRAWLARLVERLAWRGSRSSERRSRREGAAARPEGIEGTDELVGRVEVLRRVTDAVLALEEPYRSTVLLRFYEGLETSEIARRVDVPLATVRSRLQRSLVKLRERLDREHGGERETWCEALVGLVSEGLVSPDGPQLPAARQAVDASAAAGAGTGAVTMGGTAKIMALAAAAAIVGILGWSVLRDDTRSVANDARVEGQALLAPDQPPAVAPAGVLASGTSEPAPRVVPDGVAGAGASGLAALEVRVRWARDERPAAGEDLRLFAESHPVGNRVRPGRTDAEGRARFEDLQPGHVRVSSAHGADEAAYLRPGETASVELEVPVGFTVRGRVVDPDGEPVSGARLWLSTFFEPWNGSVIGTSEPDGSFELADVPPLRELGAFAEGYAPSYMHRLPQGSVTNDVELELKLSGIGGALGIRVTTSEGAPVCGTLVQVEGPLPEGRRVGNQYLYKLPTVVGWSDEGGIVALDGLPTGFAKVMAWASGMEVWKGNVTIEANGTASLAVVLRSEGVVMGTVLREDGTPVAGAHVLVRESGSLQPSAIADDAGRYELRGLSAGDLVLRAEAEDQGSASATVHLEPGAAATWDARLSIGRVVHGRVIDDTGAPIPDWAVTARSLIWGSGWGELAMTGADGAFRFVDVPREPVSIELYRDLLEPIATLTRRIVETEEELLLRVDRSALCDAGFVGHFLDVHGAPIERASVTFWPAGALTGPSAESDASGSFRRERMRPGAYELIADLPDGTTLFLGSFELEPEEVLDLGTISLGEPGRLRLTVTGRSPAESEAFDAFAFQRFDTEGNARWAGHVKRAAAGEPVSLHAGRYRVQANACPGFANESVWIDVRAGEEVSLDLTPHRGRPVTVGGELAPGSAFPERVHTVVRDAAGEVVQECLTCEPIGRRYPHLLQLVPGTYALEVEASDGRRALGSFEVDFAGAQPVELYLPLR
jgi:RNA polymerase sigma-70 factor (ECF subfamily)